MKYLSYFKSNLFSIIIISLSIAYIVVFLSVNLNIYNVILDKLLDIEPHIIISKNKDSFSKNKKIITENFNNLIIEDATENRYPKIVQYKDLFLKLKDIDLIKNYTINTRMPALLVYNTHKQNILANMIISKPNIKILEYMVIGNFLNAEKNEIVIGEKLRNKIHAKINDRIQIISPTEKSKWFKLKGTFLTGFENIDNSYVFIPYNEGNTIIDNIDSVAQINVDLYNFKKADKIAVKIRNVTGFNVSSWTNIFDDLNKEKYNFLFIQWFIYFLIIPIILLNIVLIKTSFSSKNLLISLVIGLLAGKILINLYNFFVVLLISNLFSYSIFNYNINYTSFIIILIYLIGLYKYGNKKRV